MKRYAPLLLALVLLLWPGCAGALTDGGDAALERFYFSRGGSMRPRSWEVCLCDGAWTLSENDGAPYAFPTEAAEGLARVLETHNVAAWDGFHESDPYVLDGEGFSLELSYSDGTTVFASGENAFPDGYHAAVAAINEILERARMARLQGTYRYGDNGPSITLDPDGTYAVTDGSAALAGAWSCVFDVVYLDADDGAQGLTSFVFGCDGGALLYLAGGEKDLPLDGVPVGARFERTADGTDVSEGSR